MYKIFNFFVGINFTVDINFIFFFYNFYTLGKIYQLPLYLLFGNTLFIVKIPCFLEKNFGFLKHLLQNS